MDSAEKQKEILLRVSDVVDNFISFQYSIAVKLRKSKVMCTYE